MSHRFFSYIYNLYYKMACRYAYCFVRDSHAAEDIATEALLKVWHEVKTENMEDVRRMLLVILRHKSYDYLRHEQVRREAFSDLSDWQQQEQRISAGEWRENRCTGLFAEEINRILMQTLAMLPSRTRRVFHLIRIDELTYREAALRVGISAKGIDYHVTKAQRALRLALKDYL